MIPISKKKELIAFIEQLQDENVLAQLQELLAKAKTTAEATPNTPPHEAVTAAKSASKSE